MERRNWTREEHLIAFNLYCRVPFGKIHQGNQEIIRVSKVLGRTPDALAMKMVNFARLDPAHKARGVGGLSHGSHGEVEIWDEFTKSPQQVAISSEIELEKLFEQDTPESIELPSGPTEVERVVKNRLVQSFFRRTVLASYNFCCSFCGIDIRQMLVASHIIPWSVNIDLRADPRNGIALCAFHDRAFDRGILSVDDSMHIIVSNTVPINDKNELARVGLIAISNNLMKPADRFQADPSALSYHRTNIFRT